MTAETSSKAEAQVFEYEPDSSGNADGDPAKTHVRLCDTEMLRGEVQILRGRGANLHSHPDSDGMWFVLRGEARFSTAEDELLGEFGPYEGVLIPRGYPYQFESIGDEELEILHVVATDDSADAKRRVDFEGSRIGEENRRYVDGGIKTIADPRG